MGDLETILKEKDTEINYLRETMEQNEQVIFKVHSSCTSLAIWSVKTPIDLDLGCSAIQPGKQVDTAGCQNCLN